VGTMDAAWFMDDFIVDEKRIGQKYFELLKHPSDIPTVPTGLKIQ